MKKNVLLSVIGVLLVLGIGVSFAYFVSQTLVTGDGASVTAEPGDMIKVTYDAGSAPLSGNNLMPGDSTSKDFIVTVTPTETEKEATYGIFLDITENTFVKCDDTNYNDLTNMCTRNAQELTYTITDDSDIVLASGDLTGVTGKVKLLTETKTVETQTIFNYTITITFNDTGADQNHNQNKAFSGDVKVEFAEPPAKDVILANYPTLLTRDDFRTTVTNTTTGTIYYEDTSKGRTYYFAGNPTDNWVRWAGFYWRIIRINEDGTIRMIYQGTSANTTGTATQTQTSAFNSSYNNNAYVGFKYTTNNVHGTGTPSTILGELNEWYQNNLLSYADDLDGNAGFCGDRTPSTSSSSINNSGGTGTTETYYAGYVRYWGDTFRTPTYECADSGDLYTVSSSNQGNKSLTYPIGLITMDEVWYAGGYEKNNSSYYLYTGQNYWTMSPSWYNGSALVFIVTSSGDFTSDWVAITIGVRPVVNLKADVAISSGDGTALNPYVI